MNVRNRIRDLTVGLLLVVVAFGAYFFLHVQSRELLLQEHYERLLLSSGQAITDALEGVHTNVRNAAALGKKNLRSIREGDRPQDPARAIDGKRGLIPGMEQITGASVGTVSIRPFARDTTASSYQTQEIDSISANIRISLNYQTGEPEIFFIFTRNDLPDTTFAWRIGLDRLLAPTLPREAFEGVVLARADGRVMLAEGSAPLRIGRLVPPAKPEKGAGASAIPDSSGTQIYDLTVGRGTYKVFVQPVRIPILLNSRSGTGPWQLEEYWLVAGFVPQARLRNLSMAMSPSVALSAVGLIALGLMILPILRVRFMGPREVLRYIDLSFLALAIAIGAALCTFGSLYFLLHERNASRSEDELQHLSSRIADQLNREINQLDSALVEVTRVRVHEDSVYEHSRDSAPLLRTELLRRQDLHLDPFMEMVYWIDKDGNQTSKWSTRTTTTSIVSVKERDYYSSAVSGQLWQAPPELGSLPPMFRAGRYVQSIRSITTGNESAVLSRAYHSGLSKDRSVVAAIESRLRSVIKPVLPEDEGFAVIDPEGLVQFHSDPARNVRENFFDELEADRPVREAVALREPTLVRTTYRSVPSILWISPIAWTPWSLVTFKEAQMARGGLVEVLGLSLLIYALYLFALAATIVWVFWPHRRHRRLGEPRRLWFWPQEARRPEYVFLVALLVGLIVLWLIAIGTQAKWLLIPFAALMGPATLILIRARREVTPLPGRGWGSWLDRVSTRTLHTILMTLLVVVVSVMPAVGVFCLVNDEVQVLSLEHRQNAFFQAIQDHRLDRLAWYRGVPFTRENRQTVRRNLQGVGDLSDQIGFYPPPDWAFGKSVTAGTPPSLPITQSLQWMLTRFGIPNALKAGPVNARARSWSVRNGHLLLSADNSVMPGLLEDSPNYRPRPLRPVLISSLLPSLDLLAARPAWALGILGLATLFLLMRLVLRQVFLGDFSMPPPVSGAPAAETLRVLYIRRRIPREALQDFYPIDLHDIRGARKITDLMEKYAASKCEGILLKHFDYGLRDRQIVAKKLELLESLNARYRKVKVYIESSIEPLYFLTARYNEHFKEAKDLGIDIDRWAAALQHYLRLRQPRQPDSNPAGSTATGQMGADQTLTIECAPTHVLAQIADHIRSLPDWKEFDSEGVIEAVRDMAQAHYRRLWSSCSTEEKLLLYRIAKEGLVNRQAMDVLKPLIRRGFVHMEGGGPPHLMNESFRRFVRSAERGEVIAKWEQRGEASVWGKMRTPLMLALGLLAVFFFATQREALNQTLGLLAALTAVAPGLLSAWGNLTRRQGVSTSEAKG